MSETVVVVVLVVLAVGMLGKRIHRNLTAKDGACGFGGGCGCDGRCTTCTCLDKTQSTSDQEPER